MSTFILMKIFEKLPGTYDKGMRLISKGKIEMIYDRLTSFIQEGHRVLDIGCGTGALSLRAAERGAKVKGIDVNPGMLEIAGRSAAENGLADNTTFCEMGVAELGREEDSSYDVVMSGLCFSELTRDELTFALEQVKRIIKPGGIFLVADEVRPYNLLKRFIVGLIRFFLMIITFLLTRERTRPLKDFQERLENIGFSIEHLKVSKGGTVVEIAAKK